MRSAAWVVAAAAAISIASAGCEKAGPKDRVEKHKMYVLDEGQGAKRALRYAIPAGAKQHIDFLMDMTMNIQGGGMAGGDMALPRMIMGAEIEVTKVGKDGGMDFTMIVDQLAVEDRPGSMAGVAGAMQSELDEMKGMKMTATLMPDGKSKNMKIDDSTVSAKVKQQMQTTEQTIDQMTAPLPDVPVGQGARWRVEQTLRQGGMRINQIATYELVELTDTTGTIKVEIEMDAPEQTINQNGMSVKLEHMTGHGSMTNVIAFDKIIEKVDGMIVMDMRMSAMGQSMSMSMSLGVGIGPTGSAPEPPAN
jgi:hypothetical protein